ncbi:hypothetical protein LRP88_13031 [Fusarium phalaenopsidis]
MAEVVGLVIGVAGLTPLVTSVVTGIRRLRRIRKDSTEIPEGLDALIKELSFLQVVIENADAILQGPGAGHCQGSITAVAKGIEELLDKFPLDSISRGGKPKLKEAWNLRHWKEDIKALSETIEKAKQDLVLYLGIMQAMQLFVIPCLTISLLLTQLLQEFPISHGPDREVGDNIKPRSLRSVWLSAGL